MRLLIFSVLIVSFSFGPMKAQDFLPIVKEGAVWYQRDSWGAGPDSIYLTEYAYRIEGDTIIEGVSYKNVYLFGDNYFNWSEGFWGAIREDSGMVWFRPVYDSLEMNSSWCMINYSGGWNDSVNYTEETLIYDFNLTVGDSFNVFIVDWVDSVDLGDGIQRKLISLISDDYYPIDWLEGIGSTKGLLESGCIMFENSYDLICYLDSSVRYPIGCSLLSNGPDSHPQGWSLTPNPATTSIKIEIPNSERSEVVIHNMFGEAVLRRRVSGDQLVEVLGLPAGLYSASLMQNGQNVGSQRLVIVN